MAENTVLDNIRPAVNAGRPVVLSPEEIKAVYNELCLLNRLRARLRDMASDVAYYAKENDG